MCSCQISVFHGWRKIAEHWNRHGKRERKCILKERQGKEVKHLEVKVKYIVIVGISIDAVRRFAL